MATPSGDLFHGAATAHPAARRDRAGEVFLSVVIPVYQAEAILPELGRRLASALAPLEGPHEIVLVDDGSTDRSWEEIVGLAEKFPGVVAVHLSRNFGQHYALTAGMDLARGEWTVTMDCDLQDAPEEIPRLLEKAREGFDVVLAERTARRDSFAKRTASWLFYRAFGWLSGFRMDPKVGSFRILRRPVVEAFRRMPEAYRLFGGMIQWLGFRTTAIPVAHAPRFAGRSTYTVSKLLRLTFDGIISFSNRPLFISIGIGMAMALAATGYGALLLYRFSFAGEFGNVPGWLSTMVLLAFIGGLILINLGILGIYLGRIYDQVKNRPLYVVDRTALSPAAPGAATRTGAPEAVPAAAERKPA